MFSKLADSVRRTSAWRFSTLSTTAFALGTAVAFAVVYQVISQGIRERSDAWLIGESEVLAQVATGTPSGEMRQRLMERVAEQARHEILPLPGRSSSADLPVFFLILPSDAGPALWVGPGQGQVFIDAISHDRAADGVPWSVQIPGWDEAFRVASHPLEDGGRAFLGFIDQSALALRRKVAWTFVKLWAAMVLFGFVISCLAARGILQRVENITQTAAQIGSQGLDRRVPEGSANDEIARLATTLNAMLDRIQDSVNQIRTVADAVAHDLRSPVTSIRGNLELAVTRGEPGRLQEAAVGAIDGLDHLLRTLNTSLILAEAGAGALRLDRRKVDLGEMVREMVDVYRPAAEEHGLRLELAAVAGEAVTSLDPDLTRRVVANLMDNMIQHVPSGRTVWISVSEHGGQVSLRVEDNGPGFPDELRSRVFERHVKGARSAGFGIGLALVRSIARAHGGDARILVGPEGRFTVLSVTFPLASEA